MSGYFSPNVGELLRKHRIHSGLSQEALAEVSGVSVRTISDLERGQRSSAHLATIRLLSASLGLAPNEHRQLLDVAYRDARRETPGIRGAVSAEKTATLPIPTTPFVGRATELDTLLTALSARTGKIVTVTGAGGVGKTRLAVEAASRVAHTYADGVCFVGLATIAEAGRVPDAIVLALGLAPQARQSDEFLKTWLNDREFLLLLDNLEHLLQAGPFISQLNAACPRLTILTTSRVRLRLSSEQEIPLSSLPLAGTNDPVDVLIANDANRLFADRVRLFDPNFTLSHENAVAVTEICRQLDGIPLAIELAASRLRVLSLPALLNRLDRRLPVLTGGDLDLHPRQQSLRSTIAWSYDLLAPDAKQFLRWSAVFAGGLSLDSVEALGFALHSTVDRTLELVTNVLDSGLFQKSDGPNHSPRFSLLQTVREFCLEQLEAEGELETARQFHAEYFLELVRRDFQPFYEVILPEWVVRIEAEYPNVVQAFDVLCHPETAEQAVSFAGPMALYWWRRGPLSDGQPRIARAIELAPEEPSIEKTQLLYGGAALLEFSPGNYDPYEIAWAGIEAARQVGSATELAASLTTLACVQEYNEAFDQARPTFEDALRVWESLENTMMQSRCLTLLGGIEFASENFEKAQEMEERAVRIALEIDDPCCSAGPLWYQGMIAVSQGRLEFAAAKYRDSLEVSMRNVCALYVFKATAGLAGVAAQLGMFDSAARMLGATDALLSTLGAELMPFDRPGYQRALEACLRHFRPEDLDALRAIGGNLSDDEVLAESRAIASGAKTASMPVP